MKTRSIILTFAFVILAIVGVNAQGFQLGVKGGANITSFNGRAFDGSYNYGYSLGGFAEINLSKHFGIQPELLWNEYQTRTADDANAIYNNLSGNENIKLNYLTVPVLLAFRPVKLLTIHVGPQFGYLIQQTQTLVGNVGSAFKKGDLSVLAGAQLNLGWFKLGGRYVYGVNNVDNLGNLDTWTSKGYQIYVGVRII